MWEILINICKYFSVVLFFLYVVYDKPICINSANVKE